MKLLILKSNAYSNVGGWNEKWSGVLCILDGNKTVKLKSNGTVEYHSILRPTKFIETHINLIEKNE